MAQNDYFRSSFGSSAARRPDCGRRLSDTEVDMGEADMDRDAEVVFRDGVWRIRIRGRSLLAARFSSQDEAKQTAQTFAPGHHRTLPRNTTAHRSGVELQRRSTQTA
jgi:hypothetical protein